MHIYTETCTHTYKTSIYPSRNNKVTTTLTYRHPKYSYKHWERHTRKHIHTAGRNLFIIKSKGLYLPPNNAHVDCSWKASTTTRTTRTWMLSKAITFMKLSGHIQWLKNYQYNPKMTTGTMNTSLLLWRMAKLSAQFTCHHKFVPCSQNLLET